MSESKKPSPKKPAASPAPDTSRQTPEGDQKEESSKEKKQKPWNLAPRTGQRHANPFRRKSP